MSWRRVCPRGCHSVLLVQRKAAPTVVTLADGSQAVLGNLTNTLRNGLTCGQAWSYGAVQWRSLGRGGLLRLGGAAQHVCDADRDDGAGDRSDQVDPPGGQVPDGDIGSEAAGRVHGGALVRSA